MLKMLRLQPSELDAMEFWRVEALMDNIQKHNEKEKEGRTQGEAEWSREEMMRDAKKMVPDMSKGFGNMPNMPNMPGGGSFQMPPMPSIPSFKI